jgi:hypothetical protein
VKVQELEPVKVAEPKIQEPEPEPELEPVKVAEPKTPEPPKSSPKASSGTKAKKKEPIVPISYDTWTYDELYAEAQKRDIPLRSSMNKKELIEAMEADDAEKAFPETR